MDRFLIELLMVIGFPQPKISWAKNNQELRTKDGVKMTYAQNHVRLELKNVNVKDAGRYTCTAFNDLGNASSTADLVVKSRIQEISVNDFIHNN